MCKKLIIIFLSVILFSCGEPNINENKISIAVTIPPYKNLVERITGDKFNVICSIPEGATPHHYEPTPKLIQSLSKADYYFAVGKYMEFEDVWLEKIKGINKNIIVYDLSENVEYINNDPHIWLSPSRLKIISKNMLNAVIEAAPDEKDLFNKNYKLLIDSLDLISKDLNTAFTKFENHIFLAYHGSWEYFTNDFGFRQISVEKGSKSASAKEFKNILDVVKNSNVAVIFIDPQHNKTTAEVIANDLNLAVEVLNPLPLDLLNNFYEMKKLIIRHYL